MVRDRFDLFRTSKTGNYTFNNGWMGVIAAKLRDGKEALRWAKNFLQPGVTLFDDICFGELVADFEDFKKTPEVAAHASYLCNLTQMLLDGDDAKEVTIFPAIPSEWENGGVSFEHLAAKGNLLISGQFSNDRVQLKIENLSNICCTRNFRVRLPEGTTELRGSGAKARIENGWAWLSDVEIPSKSVRSICLDVSRRASPTQ
jgi:hypothetical protein